MLPKVYADRRWRTRVQTACTLLMVCDRRPRDCVSLNCTSKRFTQGTRTRADANGNSNCFLAPQRPYTSVITGAHLTLMPRSHLFLYLCASYPNQSMDSDTPRQNELTAQRLEAGIVRLCSFNPNSSEARARVPLLVSRGSLPLLRCAHHAPHASPMRPVAHLETNIQPKAAL